MVVVYVLKRYCRKCMAYAIEDEKHFWWNVQLIRQLGLIYKSCMMIVEVI
jgi:hypothetical protein